MSCVDATLIVAGDNRVLDAHAEGYFLGFSTSRVMTIRTFIIVPGIIGTVCLGAYLAKESLISCLVDRLVNNRTLVT